jgi:hypothetical protein
MRRWKGSSCRRDLLIDTSEANGHEVHAERALLQAPRELRPPTGLVDRELPHVLGKQWMLQRSRPLFLQAFLFEANCQADGIEVVPDPPVRGEQNGDDEGRAVVFAPVVERQIDLLDHRDVRAHRAHLRRVARTLCQFVLPRARG